MCAPGLSGVIATVIIGVVARNEGRGKTGGHLFVKGLFPPGLKEKKREEEEHEGSRA